MTKSLFESFDEVSAKQWKQKIQFDLKGADYNEALIFKSLEGIDVKPFYNQEDIANIADIENPSSWRNAIKIYVEKASLGNQQGLNRVNKGAESVFFVIQEEDIDPGILLQNFSTEIPIYIQTEFLSTTYARQLDVIAKTSGLSIYLLNDNIHQLASTGNWFQNLNSDFSAVEEIAKQSNTLKSTISVDLSLYQNAGATMVQQLAYSLAHANEYLNFFNTKNFNSLENNEIVFKVSVGGNYFFEIAKIRALRLLWSSLSSEYNVLDSCHILAFPSHRNKTILDYNVNMLRTTTECMSAILGGADTIHNLPYDNIYNLENDFGTRISINQLLILKNESYFDLVNNPASGSYYIETLTNQLAEEALLLFKNLEKGGGFLNQLKSGNIQRKLKESAKKEQELFDNSEIVLTGSNKYQNTEEILPVFQKQVFLSKNVRKTLLEPIIKSRLSEIIEKKSQ